MLYLEKYSLYPKITEQILKIYMNILNSWYILKRDLYFFRILYSCENKPYVTRFLDI